jgi:putative transposon-encoded protein
LSPQKAQKFTAEDAEAVQRKTARRFGIGGRF